VSAVGDALAIAGEFPFVASLPKREKTKRMKLLEVIDALEAVQVEKGPVIPQSLAAEILGVSRARICQLVDEGRLESFDLNGTRFVFAKSFLEFCKEDRPTGIQRGKAYSTLKASVHWGKAMAEASLGEE
jgi:hypothetical protein